jgi:hypothetical protein
MSLSGLYKGTTFLAQSPMGPMSWKKDIPQGPAAPVLLGSAFSTGAAVFAAQAAGTAFTFLGVGGTAGILASFFVRASLGYALNVLTSRSGNDAATSGAYASVNALTPAGATAFIYGSTRLGGVTFYQQTTENNKYLHKLIAVAGHEVNSIGTIYLNDEVVTIDGNGNVTSPSQYNGKVRLKIHLGGADQEADADLVSESLLWTVNHRARGIAYIYARFLYDADAFPNGVPVVTVIAQGKKLYDPRTETTVYSSNAALCLRDYLVSSEIASASEVDNALFATAANICDEEVEVTEATIERVDVLPTLDLYVGRLVKLTTDGEYYKYTTGWNIVAIPTQLRYTTNGTFTSEATPQDALYSLLRSMGGMLWYSQGKWGCKAAAYTSSVLSLNEDDLRSGLQIQTRNSRRDGFNKVTGKFRGPESNYFETNYPTIAPSAFLQVDNNQESELELSFPYVDSSAMAQRIAKIALYRNREQLKISGSFGMRAYQLSIGDLVQITNTRLGFTDKVFEVVEWRFGLSSEMTLEVFMTLQEISAGVFEWDADETAFESNNTSLLSPYAVPAVGIVLTQEYRIINEHITNVLVAEITSPNAERVDSVEVVFKKNDDADFSALGTGDLGRFELLDIETPLAGSTETITYEVRARAINALGVKGDYASAIKVVEADTVGPDAPTAFTKQLSAGTVFFRWDASTALDLSHYKIWHSSSITAVWNDGSVFPIIEKVARPATSVTYPALSGTFFIEPYDKSGNAGAVASVVVLVSELPILGIAVEDIENPTFLGTKTNATVVSSELQMSSYATAPASGTYEFTGYIDTSTIRTVRVSNELVVNRVHSNAVAGEVNWDDISSSFNWDQWPDNWDTWTDEDANFGDFTVIIYISATNTDPAGSPVWGDWTVAAGEKNGRAFKFKAELTNVSNNVTPSISVLKGIVEY